MIEPIVENDPPPTNQMQIDKNFSLIFRSSLEHNHKIHYVLRVKNKETEICTKPFFVLNKVSLCRCCCWLFLFFSLKKIDFKTVNLNNKKTHFSFFFRLTYLCIHKCVFQPGTTPLSFEICDKCGFEFRFISVAGFIRVIFIPLIRVGAHLFIYLFFPNSLSFILSFLFVFFLI